MKKREINLYIASSLDSKIAGPGGDISWLDDFNQPDEDYGYQNFLASVDTTLMGHATYDQIVHFEGDFPYRNKTNYVFTHNTTLTSDENVTFVSKDHLQFIRDLVQRSGENIWLIGGGKINHFFLEHKLIDHLILFIIPVVLGDGVPLFERSEERRNLKLKKSHLYNNGVLELNYRFQYD